MSSKLDFDEESVSSQRIRIWHENRKGNVTLVVGNIE